MALFNIIGKNFEEEFNHLMDQDWNHWKLQMQSWMEDANEAEAKAGAQPTAGSSCGTSRCGPSNCGPSRSCGSSARQNSGFRSHCGRNARGNEEIINPLDVLHNLWTQFASASQQQQRSAREEATNNVVKDEQRKYTIKLDVQHFEPNEITVKIVENTIVVDGEHPERTDRLGRVSRKFQRKYELPADVEANTIVSTLTPSGVLIIEGLKKSVPNESEGEIVIPVVREETNNSAENPKEYSNDQPMD